MNQFLTVSELTKQIKIKLEEGFASFTVIGEISGFKPHVSSGHWYFNLKDSIAVICCTMWRANTSYVFFTPQDGMRVIISGRITVYPPRGNYQIDVRSMRPAGAGELQAAFEMLKQKLLDEGLFSKEFKKEISLPCKKVGIVTASDGAALQDMISIARRRFPIMELVLYSARMQGMGAAEDIIRGIKLFNKEPGIDVIILARGGGSIEDLWPFNEEILARAIFDSKVPVITGVGHEIDFTIADFVADLRAPTPSAAMEIITPDMDNILKFLEDFEINTINCLNELIEKKRKKINNITSSYGFRVPIDIVRRRSQEVDNLLYILSQKLDRKILLKKSSLNLLAKAIEGHDVRKTLKKGFTLIKQDSKYVVNLALLDRQKPAEVSFIDGEIAVKVLE